MKSTDSNWVVPVCMIVGMALGIGSVGCGKVDSFLNGGYPDRDGIYLGTKTMYVRDTEPYTTDAALYISSDKKWIGITMLMDITTVTDDVSLGFIPMEKNGKFRTRNETALGVVDITGEFQGKRLRCLVGAMNWFIELDVSYDRKP